STAAKIFSICPFIRSERNRKIVRKYGIWCRYLLSAAVSRDQSRRPMISGGARSSAGDRPSRRQSECDRDLAEMPAFAERPERFDRLVEGIDAVDDRPEAARRDGPVHRLEHVPAADVDALQPRPFEKRRHKL